MLFLLVAFCIAIGTVVRAQELPTPLTPESIRGIPAALLLDHYFAEPDAEIRARVVWFHAADKELEALKASLQKGELRGYEIEIRILKQSAGRVRSKAAWKTSLPIAERGTRAFTIPAHALKPGIYNLSLWLRSPNSQPLSMLDTASSPDGTQAFEFSPVSHLHVGSFSTRYAESRVRDASVVLRSAVFVENPALTLRRYSAPTEAMSRTVWDMLTFQGKIYFGSGDWQRNTAPAPVFELSLTPDGRERTEVAYIIPGEAVTRLRSLSGRLYVPDIDPAEPWDLGTIYEMSAGQWEKKRTVPNAVHSFDVESWGGRLFVSTGTAAGATLFVSGDDGNTWTRVPGDDAAMSWDLRFQQMAVLNGELLIMPSPANQAIWRLTQSGLQRVETNLLPGLRGLGITTTMRFEKFGDEVIYTADFGVMGDEQSRSMLLDQTGQPRTNPLYILKDLAKGAEILASFKDLYVTDIDVSDERCLVLTAKQHGETFVGSLYRSTDLVEWTRLAEFNTDAVPYSVAELNGKYYVGLGNRSYSAADKAAGAILRLEENRTGAMWPRS